MLKRPRRDKGGILYVYTYIIEAGHDIADSKQRGATGSYENW
jgi:hypothetical protein